MPTLTTTLGIQGERPCVGTWDCKDVVHVFGSVNLVTGQLTHHLFESQHAERRRDGLSKTSRMQREFARHIEQVGRTYPADSCLCVVLLVDGANWHRGRVVDEALRANPHVLLYTLPPYSPELQPIEKLWRPLRHDVSHNVLYDAMPRLSAALRRRLREYQRKPYTVLRAVGLLQDLHAP
ncbi:transposase [Myxococcus xanthus]|uniref:transposase n=1 Tax=Myxococcus xanthus TaxID=34 RepID=UPI001CEDD4B6|nr:transposase [Myxococcus xanthus]